MLKFMKKVKHRRSIFHDAGGTSGDAWRNTDPALRLGDDSQGAYLSSYREAPILDWQPPLYDPDPRLGEDSVSEAMESAGRAGADPSTTPNSPTFPTLPLPLELMHLIIDNYLSQDLKPLLNLGSAVPHLRHHCWTHAFRSVKILLRQRESERKKLTSNVDLFLQLLGRLPSIYDYIGELDVQDRGRLVWAQQGLASSSQEDLTTLSLLLVQTKRMSKMKSLRITTSLTWTILPLHVKEAFFAMFASSTLSEISLSGLLIPANFLALIKDLRMVDFRAGGVGPPLFHPSLVNQPPKRLDRLKIRDRNPFSNPMSVVGFSDCSHKPFSLAHLKHLEICLPGKRLSSAQDGLARCERLEILKVFVGTAGGLPEPLSLDCLPLLRKLTLAADITNIVDASPRFDWSIELLQSIPPTSLLDEVTFIIRTPSLEQGKQCEWGLLDALFHLPEVKPSFLNPRPQAKLRWPSLSSFTIVWCTARSQDIQEDANADFVTHLPIFIPHLYVRNVVTMHTTYSDSYYNFWTYA